MEKLRENHVANQAFHKINFVLAAATVWFVCIRQVTVFVGMRLLYIGVSARKAKSRNNEGVKSFVR
eukprot:3095288-Amphidinium_carterae.1